ncbi:MFS transporter [Steroidobacter sp.]|uniref:MFS transporter n=1 Tax=Steroidobacter sp. TaxID=1978227 RepID=UPI001A6041D2|nr:MFS transporter [Steroidobacter sp.]MBL8267125.1 MFS transporter [Steroidobacter sp.]
MPPQRLFVLIAGNFFVATSFLSVGGLLNDISTSLQVPIEKAGLLIAAFGIAAAICAPALATLGSRIDRRKLLTGSMAVCAIANLLAALSETYEHLLLARVLAAVTSAVYTPQVAATLSMLMPEKERAPTLAKLMVGWSVGAVLGNPISVLIASLSSWRMSFAFIGASSAVIAFFIWRSLPANVMVPPLNWHRWFYVLRSPALRWLTAATALTNVGSVIMMSYIAPIVQAVQGISGAGLALLLFMAGVGSLLAICCAYGWCAVMARPPWLIDATSLRPSCCCYGPCFPYGPWRFMWLSSCGAWATPAFPQFNRQGWWLSLPCWRRRLSL